MRAPVDMLAQQSILEPESDAAESIVDLWWVMFAVSAVVVAVVTMLLLLAVLRRRGKLTDRTAQRIGGRNLVAFGGVALPLVILFGIFALTVETLADTSPSGKRSALEIEVTGRQFFWDVRYPGTGAITANEIHVPVGVPVRIAVRTGDVIHSFWVPRLNRKIDMIPDRDNAVTFEVDTPGTYRGQCAEFCGLSHANMAFLVIAQPPDEFREWLADTARPAVEPPTPSAERGQDVFLTEGCADCHTIRGTPADGEVGPDLTHLGDRETLAAVTLDLTRGDLGGWILDPQHIKPGNKMPGLDLDGPELQALLDYLLALE